MRTVQELEAAGASALTIEDTLLPHAFGASGTGMVSLEEGLGKIRAALAARSDPELMILARTSAPRMAGPDEVLARIRAYDQSGADALFVSGVSSRSLLEAIVASTTLPLCLGATGPEVRDADFLRKCGVRLWLHGHQPMMAALRAVQDSMIGLAGPGARPAGDAETAANLLGKVVRDGYFDDCVQNFLTPDGAARANTSRH
jgi:carboxyvinyl-carboxyphosphonate phosphorylmutase